MTYQPPWWTCLDGMSIKELVEYCPEIDKGRVFGTVDYGDKMTMDEVDDKTPANEALVCVCLLASEQIGRYLLLIS